MYVVDKYQELFSFKWGKLQLKGQHIGTSSIEPSYIAEAQSVKPLVGLWLGLQLLSIYANFQLNTQHIRVRHLFGLHLRCRSEPFKCLFCFLFKFPKEPCMKNLVLGVRVTPQQRERLEQLAGEAGMSLSHFLRTLLESAELVSKPEVKAVVEMQNRDVTDSEAQSVAVAA